MIDNKIANKITKVSRKAPQNNSETATNEAENIGLDREIPKYIYIYIYIYICAEKNIDDLRLI